VVFLIAGVLLYWVLVPRLQGSANPEMLSIILFFGLSQVIEAVTTIFLGTSERSIQSRALGTSISAIKAKIFGGKPDSGGPVQIFGQGFPASWVIAAVPSWCWARWAIPSAPHSAASCTASATWWCRPISVRGPICCLMCS
jgi:branched-chain amino acid transport system permease protein